MGSGLKIELIRCRSNGVNSHQKGWVIPTPLGHSIRSKTKLEIKMDEVVNLRTARKRAARAQSEAHAAEKRLLHGRSKEQRSLAKTQKAKAQRDLDQHRINRGEGR
jgi:hypothetical protein